MGGMWRGEGSMLVDEDDWTGRLAVRGRQELMRRRGGRTDWRGCLACDETGRGNGAEGEGS